MELLNLLRSVRQIGWIRLLGKQRQLVDTVLLWKPLYVVCFDRLMLLWGAFVVVLFVDVRVSQVSHLPANLILNCSLLALGLDRALRECVPSVFDLVVVPLEVLALVLHCPAHHGNWNVETAGVAFVGLVA